MIIDFSIIKFFIVFVFQKLITVTEIAVDKNDQFARHYA